MVDWQVCTVKELRQRYGVQDRDIIPECARRGIAWVTADESAEADHAQAIRTHRLSVLFVRRHRSEGLSRAYQLALVAAALGHFEAYLETAGTHAILCEVRWQTVQDMKVAVLERLPRYRRRRGRAEPAARTFP